MNVTYENQGAETLAVYQLETEEHLDSFAKGMLQGNEITGLLKPSFLKRDAKEYLKYQITSKIPLKDYMQGEMEKKVLMELLLSMVKTVREMEEYMLTQQKLLLETEHIFVDISRNQVFFIYLPVDEFVQKISMKEFLLHLLSHTCYQLEGDLGYVARLFNCLNRNSSSELTDICHLLKELLEEETGGVPIKEPVPRPVTGLMGQPVHTSGPILEAAMASEPELAPPVTMETGDSVSQEEKKKKRRIFEKKEKKEKKIKTSKHSAQEIQLGIAIPGMETPVKPEVVLTIDGETGNYISEPLDTPEVSRPKKRGLFLSKKRTDTSPESVSPEPSQVPPAPVQQQIYHQAKEGATVYMGKGSSDDENKTVIMGGGSDYSSTVLLGEKNPVMGGSFVKGQLTRKRNRQSMTINKEVFHLGKESRYADFYIGDNPAVSAAHADIFIDDGQFYISDRNSVNHTYVNGQMVSAGERCLLKSGDVISLGNEEFDFMIC